ncbi:MAG: MFS transporter, partial [Dehalococcoidia bacterium]|nr:MFS transporter [Dehalococcoidia bacterium]
MAALIRSILRERFYYGWVIVAVGFATEFVLVSLRFYGLSLFVKPMSADLGWSRAAISGVLSFGTVVEGLVAPIVGPIIDKRGGRGLMIFGAIISGGAYIALGLVQNLWDFYLLRGVVITIGIVCAGPLVISVAISNWFIRGRGKAMSMSLMGVSLGGAVLTPNATYIILTYGWRAAWMVLGVVIWIVVIPLAALYMKRRPEDIGLLPDGDAPSGDRGRAPVPCPLSPVPQAEVIWTRREAMRTSALWLTILAFGLSGMGGGAMGIHFFPFLTDLPISSAAAAAIFSGYAIAMTCLKPLWGFLIDKYNVRRVAIGSFAALAIMQAFLIALPLWPSFWL